jgi:hypothetical protein
VCLIQSRLLSLVERNLSSAFFITFLFQVKKHQHKRKKGRREKKKESEKSR